MKLLNHLRDPRPILAGGLLLLGTAIGFGQATKPASVKAQAPKKILMWEAKSGPNTVYLLGSIHLGSKDMYPLPKVIDQAFNKSKAMVVEVDIDSLDPMTAMKFIQNQGMYQEGDNLWKHLSKTTGDKVKKYFADYGMDADAAGKFKPWLAGVMAEVLPMTKAGMDPSLGIDKHFLDLAQGKKKIEQAESADFQLKLLASLPDNLADTYLSFTVDSQIKSKEDDLKLMKLWKAGDADALNQAISDHPKALDGLMRSMLQDRNPHMADVAEKYLKGGGPCFFVVGAAHLIGDEGVVALLKKRGYAVRQLTTADAH